MDKNQTYYERIHRYFDQDMTAAERAAFESEMQQDESLRRDVLLEKTILKGIVKQHRDSTGMAAIDKVNAQLEQSGFFKQQATAIGRNRAKKRLVWLGAIAAVCFGVSFGIWTLFVKTPRPAQLYAAYFAPDTIRLYGLYDELSAYGLLESQATPKRDQLKVALANYHNDNYKAADAQLEVYLGQNPGDRQAQFARAVCQLAMGNTAIAQELLEPLARAVDFEWHSDATWYLTLCRLQREGPGEAVRKALAELAADPASPYREQAAALLADIQ